MFVPDDARRRKRLDKLSPSAWEVYESHCEHRSHRLRVSFTSREMIVAETGLSHSGVKNATTELRKKGWIREEKRGGRKLTHLLIGDFTPVDKRHLQAASNQSGQKADQTRTS